jgi:hypothetical protein
MTRAAQRVWLPLIVLLQLGCGDEGPDELTYGDLEGVWVPLSLVYTKVGDPSTTFDFIAASGSGSLHFEPDSTYLLILVPNPASPSEEIVGPVALDGPTVVLVDPADPALTLMSGTLVEGRLTLESESAKHDFDGDGIDETAHVEAIFMR